MVDRNSWDEDRRWRSARGSSDYDDDEDEYGSSFGGSRYGRRQGQRQSWQQDYSGEFDRDQSFGSGQSYGSGRSYGSGQSYEDDYAARRAGGSRYGSEDQSDYGAGRTYQSGQGQSGLGQSGQGGWRGQSGQFGQSQGRMTYRSQPYGPYESSRQQDQSYRAQGPRYDDRTEYQTSERRYAGTGYSHYGAGASSPTGDYFTGGDYGSGAHAWDRNSTQASAGSGRYGSTYSETGYRGETGRGETGWGDYGSGAYGARGGYGSGQSYQREMGSTASTQGAYGHQERGFLQRAGDEVMSWFGDEEAARRREMDHRGQGPSDYTRSDERIREDANDRLTDDWRVDARRISVTVQEGELTLSGTVPSRDAKHRAEECVEHIAGVHHVQNNLRVDSSAMNHLTGSGTQSSLGSAGSSTGTSTSAGAKTSSATGTTTGSSSTTATGNTGGNTGAASRGSTTGSTSA